MDKEDLHGESGTIMRGHVGVFWTQLELAKQGIASKYIDETMDLYCLLYTSPSPRD